jgi:hypothetical protein
MLNRVSPDRRRKTPEHSWNDAKSPGLKSRVLEANSEVPGV